MINFAPRIQELYLHSLETVGDDDPYAGLGCLGIRDVLKAHYLIADHFYSQGSGLGGIGPKSMDMLNSALYRQHITNRGVPKWPHKLDICATLFFGLIKNHPFHDANKRTAFLSLLYHLETMSLCPTVSQKDLENFSVEVADNRLDRHKRYKKLLKSEISKDDAAVRYISYYIRRNTRRVDKRYYELTYKNLQTSLNRFGYELQNPRKNFIDVVRKEERRKIFGILGEREKIDVKVTQVAFPGWNSRVSRSTVSNVRKATGLTPDKGVDSQTFFKDADPLSILISKYQDPLRRLADR